MNFKMKLRRSQLPATPLDGAFDVARVKCLGITDDNFPNISRGPYHHNFYDD